MKNTKSVKKYLTVLGTVMVLTASIFYFAASPDGSLAIAAKDSNTNLIPGNRCASRDSAR